MQQITTRLNILHILKMQGVKVYNQAKAIERTVDKGMTSFLLLNAGIATPQTWVCESRQLAHQIIETQTKYSKLVLKPLFGSQGRGLRLLDSTSKYPLPMDFLVDGVFYLQKFIEAKEKNHDFRVFVISHQAVATMRRNGKGWLNNIAQGAHCEYVVDEEVVKLAEQASIAIDINYCGVDIMRDKQGKLWVIEVNSIPAWYGLQSVTNQNIAQLLVDDLLKND
jgi:RimK family alpha-L-glutamate ligase